MTSQAGAGGLSANAFTGTGWCSPWRRMRESAGRAGPFFQRQRPAGRPNGSVRLNANNIGQAKGCQRGAQIGIGPGDHQHAAARQAGHSAARACSSAISGLVAKPILSGTPAVARRLGSLAHSRGR